MKGTFVTWLATALSLLIVDLIVPGVDIATFAAAILAAIVIGFINASVKPILSILSLPITLLTLGAFSLIVNGFCFWLAAVLVPGFSVKGIIGFILGPVVLSLANTFLSKYFASRSDEVKDVKPEA
ncbi:MAG: phage holin family protein [Nostocaceae cyanobacterium]|nr:phage holin family protein [Nostocaceae cyanobacterium]